MKLPEKIEKKIEKVTESGCWIWVGALSSNGYGNVHTGSSFMVAHKHVYELVKGKVQPGLDLDHLCRIRCCVNPDHLEPVSRKENLRRGGVIDALKERAKGWKKDVCCRGHAMTPDNIYVYPNSKKRACIECLKILRHNNYLKRRSNKCAE